MHKVSKTLAPSNVICDREHGVIIIDSVDGSKIIINDISFDNWNAKFKGLIINDGHCSMNKESRDSTVNVFFEQLTNLIYSKLIATPADETDSVCNNILNVVSQHILKGN